MTNIRRALEAAAAVGGDATYVEDVFSTYLYTGDGGTQTITNGIDLSGEGGMVWGKGRNVGRDNILTDTERGASQTLISNSTAASADESPNYLSAFNSNGFEVKGGNALNASGQTTVGWSFRKAPGFFDVVTWTGNSVAGRQISHSLGSVPGFIAVKRLDDADNWKCYHVGNPAPAEDYAIEFDNNNAAGNDSVFNDTIPTSTYFTLNGGGAVNGNTMTYVAYVFANDAQEFGADSDESIIKCGSYTTDGSGDASVTLGWEPQWVLDKTSTYSAAWSIVDMMRGFDQLQDNGYQQAAILAPSSTAAESMSGGEARINATGFTVTGTTASQTFIYIAIRRPMKVPEAGTEVFAMDSLGGGPPGYEGLLTDWSWARYIDTTDAWNAQSRLSGETEMELNTSDAEGSDSNIKFDYMDGWLDNTATAAAKLSWLFKRAPEVFDVVAYTGTGGGAGTGQTLAHNLAVVPEMMIVRRRDAGANWTVYHEDSDSDPEDYGLELNENGAAAYNANSWNRTLPTSTQFTAGNNINASGGEYMAYLFATLEGVSKVGGYIADGTLTTIDCGFSTGARLVIIKRKDVAGGWYVYDYYRGIVAGNEPYLFLNTTADEITGTDYIDPDNSGFQLTAAGSATININLGEYIFLAIA